MKINKMEKNAYKKNIHIDSKKENTDFQLHIYI